MSDEEMIDQSFQELLNDYLATKHRKRVEVITKAFNFANQAHKGVKRQSGEPYIMHPLAVAKIVCNEIGLGSTSIVLHCCMMWLKIPITRLKILKIYSVQDCSYC
jgi:GTP pyrophosphokinase